MNPNQKKEQVQLMATSKKAAKGGAKKAAKGGAKKAAGGAKKGGAKKGGSKKR